MYSIDAYGRYTYAHATRGSHGPLELARSIEVTAVSIPPKWKRTSRLRATRRAREGSRTRNAPPRAATVSAPKKTAADCHSRPVHEHIRTAMLARPSSPADSARAGKSQAVVCNWRMTA